MATDSHATDAAADKTAASAAPANGNAAPVAATVTPAVDASAAPNAAQAPAAAAVPAEAHPAVLPQAATAGATRTFSAEPEDEEASNDANSGPGAWSIARSSVGFFFKLLHVFLSMLKVVFFPPHLLSYFAELTWRWFGWFWIFPLEPFQLAAPAIAIGPALCLLTFYGFPTFMAAFIYGVVNIYVFYTACTDSPWEGARSFFQWGVIAGLLLVVLGFYVEAPIFASVWAWVDSWGIPFPPQLIVMISVMFFLVYLPFLIRQMFCLRVTIKKGSMKVTKWGKEAATHSLERYDFREYWHDANEQGYGCKGLKFIPGLPNLPAYDFPIVSGAARYTGLLNEAKNIPA